MKSNHSMSDRLIWMDLEMTGLDPEVHVILEIATIVTDGNLEIVAEGPDIVVNHTATVLASMDEWSEKHHRASGLLEGVRNSEYDCLMAQQATLDFLSGYCEAGSSPICGNSIGQDRRFLVKHMPDLESFFHYRNIDVSSVGELVRRWYPDLESFHKKKTHLALSDIRESIEELRYYRGKVFR